jgi:hypothetical protein
MVPDADGITRFDRSEDMAEKFVKAEAMRFLL